MSYYAAILVIGRLLPISHTMGNHQRPNRIFVITLSPPNVLLIHYTQSHGMMTSAARRITGSLIICSSHYNIISVRIVRHIRATDNSGNEVSLFLCTVRVVAAASVYESL